MAAKPSFLGRFRGLLERALLVLQSAAPSTASTQVGLWATDGTTGISGTARWRAPSDGTDRPAQSFGFAAVFNSGATPSGNVYNNWATLYADWLAYAAASVLDSPPAHVNLRTALAIGDGGSGGAAGQTYDLGRFEFWGVGGSFTTKDTTVLTRPPYAFHDLAVSYESITTRTYTGAVRGSRLWNCSLARAATSTQEPFDFTSGTTSSL